MITPHCGKRQFRSVLAKFGRMSISLHPAAREGPGLAASPVGGCRAAGRRTGPKIRSRLFTKYVGAVRRGGRRRAALQRHFRGLFLLSGAQGGADPHPARAGGSGGGEDQPVHQGNRKPARLDHPTAVVGGLDRAAPVRRVAAAAPGAGHHRTGAGRFHRQGAVAGVAPRHGRGRQRPRSFQGAEVHRGGRATRSTTARSISAGSPSPT